MEYGDSRSDEDDLIYEVVVNDEEQYSIWAVERMLPSGWYTVGVRGRKSDCLDHIEHIWTDMRPRSLRDTMEGEDQRGRPPSS